MPNPINFDPNDYQAWHKHFQQQGEVWIFGYGSLMWRPDFAHSGGFQGSAWGVARRYCIVSIAYRGTPESPGRVLGLVEAETSDTRCHGIAYRVGAQDLEASLLNVWQREMISEAYRPKIINVTLNATDAEPQKQVQALCFLADPDHVQYDASTSEADIIRIIGKAVGPKGSNRDYFNDTYQHLLHIGVQDDYLARLNQALQKEQS